MRLRAKIKPEFLKKILRGEKRLEIRQVESIELVCSSFDSCSMPCGLTCSHAFEVVDLNVLESKIGMALFEAVGLPVSRHRTGSPCPFIILHLGDEIGDGEEGGRT
jgi:hypothetical protein